MLAFKVVSILLTAAVLQSLSTLSSASPINPRTEVLLPSEGGLPERAEDGTEDDGNAWERSGYFEGDITLPQKLFRNGRIQNGRPQKFFSQTIAYKIDNYFNKEQRQAIKQAMHEFHGKTCIRFKPATSVDLDVVNIVPNGRGCTSEVGRTGGNQFIRLAPSIPGIGCFRHGVLVHELLHTTGFYHQHSVPERDDYVTILYENIRPEAIPEFSKLTDSEINSFGVEYDYDSIMHYSSRAFSKNGKDTIAAKRPGVTIGQRDRLSKNDIKKLHLMYGCPVSG